MPWIAEFMKLLWFVYYSSKSHLFRNRSLPQCTWGLPIPLQGKRVAEAVTQTWDIISSAAHKASLFNLSGFPIFLTPCSTSQVSFSCNSMNSALHHNILLPPYVPKIFSSLPPPQHGSIPCSHQCTLLSACPTNTASVSSVGHLAWQTDWPGGHCL